MVHLKVLNAFVGVKYAYEIKRVFLAGQVLMLVATMQK
jgi:hypothetical protein